MDFRPLEVAAISAAVVFILHCCRRGFCMVTMLSPNRVHILDIGESLLMDCQFFADKYNLFDYPVLWRKVQSTEDVQVNIMGNINEPFLSEDRFDVSFSITPPRYSLHLSIRGVQQEDSGNYTCEVRGPQSVILREITHYLYIRAPVTSLTLSTGNREVDLAKRERQKIFHLVENQPTKLRCSSLGGYPPPKLQMYVERNDVTSEFTFKESIELSGRKGLRLLQYRSELVTFSYLPKADEDGALLNCVATVAELRPFIDSVKLDVDYSPQINCSPAFAYLGDKSVVVECRVSSKPLPSVAFWIIDDNGTRMNQGDMHAHYYSLVSVQPDNSVQMQLIVSQVRREHFRRYTAIVENRVTIAAQDVDLVQRHHTSSRQRHAEESKSRENARDLSRDSGRRFRFQSSKSRSALLRTRSLDVLVICLLCLIFDQVP